MRERAYAKINLCLDVAGKREDGYHELKMIMVPVDFYDVLDMEPAMHTSLTLNKSYIPANEKNTIVKAIQLMQQRYQFDFGFRCTLQKHIPTRAGLAGGSADAAAAIRIMDRMLKLHMTREEKIDIAKQVGADVPFCVINRPAYVEGIGEQIHEFSCNPNFELLLVKPRKGVSTKEAFEIIDKKDPVHPDCFRMQEALMDGDYDAIVDSLGNSLEDAAVELVEEIRDVKKYLVDAGFDGVLMSGSGSTVFGITQDQLLVDDTMHRLKKEHFFVRKTHILNGFK